MFVVAFGNYCKYSLIYVMKRINVLNRRAVMSVFILVCLRAVTRNIISEVVTFQTFENII
jgi:hypothetical protein